MSDPIHVISLGAGVQSSTMALMAAKGEITPMPTAAVFADTGAEPAKVYDWLDWLERELPFPVHKVTNGNLTDESLKPRKREKDGGVYMKRLIPVFGIMPDGKKTAAIGRKCTADYKIKPILKKVKEIAAIGRGEKFHKVTQWIGISMDEIQRMKDPSHPWTKHRWPLIEKRLTRGHCLEWMEANGYPPPPEALAIIAPSTARGSGGHCEMKVPKNLQKQ
jgi:hypothetical protein